MSITDELRMYVKTNSTDWGMNNHVKSILAIADRIEEQHTKECIEVYNNGVHDGIDADKDAMGYIKLPVDADGEVIHMGDVMDTEHFGTVEVEGFIHNAIAFYNYSGQLAYLCTSPANLCHHHHEPTVEDVLREFADRVCNSGHQWGLDAADTIAEYAAKLRLAGDAE